MVDTESHLLISITEIVYSLKSYMVVSENSLGLPIKQQVGSMEYTSMLLTCLEGYGSWRNRQGKGDASRGIERGVDKGIGIGRERMHRQFNRYTNREGT